MFNSHAVSEVIAIVLLIAVVVMGVGIVLVSMYSQPLPEETPHLNILISNTSTSVLLTHNGGDALPESSISTVVDGATLNNGAATITSGDGTWPWSLGETLTYPVAGIPHQVQVLYPGSGSAVLLKSAALTGGELTDTPDTPSTGSGGGIDIHFDNQDELDAFVVEQFVGQLESDSIYFTRAERGAQGVFEGTLQFTVAAPGSYIVIGSNPRTNLAIGDAIRMEFAQSKTPDLMFFMLGNKGWSIQVQGDGVNDLRIYVRHNGVWGPDISGNGDLTESWITDYSDYTSTLNFSVKGGTEHTRLIINNVTLLDDQNSETFVFYQIEPAKPTLLVMQYASTGALGNGVYFVGKAQRVTREAEQIYP